MRDSALHDMWRTVRGQVRMASCSVEEYKHSGLLTSGMKVGLIKGMTRIVVTLHTR